MSLQSTGTCPHCNNEVDMKKRIEGAFVCPRCDCRFSHNWKKWFIALPIVPVAVAAQYFIFGHVDITNIGASIAVAAFLTVIMPDYKIVSKGAANDDIELTPRVSVYKKESPSCIIFMILLLIVIGAVLVWSVTSAI